MIGTIEDLEREIEQFQKNVMASGELVTLLKQMLEQIKDQNKSFEQGAVALIKRMDALPEIIENENSASNAKIKADISNELAQFMQKYSDEQNQYSLQLKQTGAIIKSAEEKLDVSYKEFIDTLGKTNISNLYDQNQQLKKTLNIRTTILMAVSAVSVVLGIVGLII